MNEAHSFVELRHGWHPAPASSSTPDTLKCKASPEKTCLLVFTYVPGGHRRQPVGWWTSGSRNDKLSKLTARKKKTFQEFPVLSLRQQLHCLPLRCGNHFFKEKLWIITQWKDFKTQEFSFSIYSKNMELKKNGNRLSVHLFCVGKIIAVEYHEDITITPSHNFTLITVL